MVLNRPVPDNPIYDYRAAIDTRSGYPPQKYFPAASCARLGKAATLSGICCEQVTNALSPGYKMICDAKRYFRRNLCSTKAPSRFP